MTFVVVFHPFADADLDQIYEFIAGHSPVNAIAFVRRLREYCRSLAHMPRRGRVLPEFAGENRAVPFESRATIFYGIDARRVTILRIRYGGQADVTIPGPND